MCLGTSPVPSQPPHVGPLTANDLSAYTAKQDKSHLCLGLRQDTTLVTGVFSAFAPVLTPAGAVLAWVPSDLFGCRDYAKPGVVADGGVAIVRRGANCTFKHKAEQAQHAGAQGVIILCNSSQMVVMGSGNSSEGSTDVKIMVLEVTKETGDKIVAVSKRQIMFSFEACKWPTPDLAEIMIIFLGTGLVPAGAYFSTSDLSTGGSLQAAVQPVQEQVMEVDHYLAIGFFCFGSISLVILYFFMPFLIYVIIFVFSLGGFNTLMQIGSIFLQWSCPPLKSKLCAIPSVGPVVSADVVAGVPALASVHAWVVLRNTTYAWPFQDLIGSGFLCLAADDAAAKHQGVPLAAPVPEERHCDRCHWRSYWRADADAFALAHDWRPTWSRPHVGYWRHCIAWSPRLVLAQARPPKLAGLVQGLLSAPTHTVLRWTLLHDSCPEYHADGPANSALPGARDPWHHCGARLLSRRAGGPLGGQAMRTWSKERQTLSRFETDHSPD